MSDHFDIDVSGTDAIGGKIDPVAGRDGLPLGPDGNGAPGKAGWFECKEQAGIGQPGNHGWGAPPAAAGGNGKPAWTVTIECAQFEGLPLALRNNGGNGAAGQDGGKGGDGRAGGDAGHQPRLCRDLILGGIGGDAGKGGNAGPGGNGGHAANVTVWTGSGLTGIPLGSDNRGGKQGKAGSVGSPGTPGAGGRNSDGTQAAGGANPGSGLPALDGAPGKSGTFSQVASSKPGTYLKIAIISQLAG